MFKKKYNLFTNKSSLKTYYTAYINRYINYEFRIVLRITKYEAIILKTWERIKFNYENYIKLYYGKDNKKMTFSSI